MSRDSCGADWSVSGDNSNPDRHAQERHGACADQVSKLLQHGGIGGGNCRRGELLDKGAAESIGRRRPA